MSLAAVLLAAAAAAGSLAAAPTPQPLRAQDVAVRLASWGARPAASLAQARAHRL